jgi:hypothetical protein
MGAYLREHNHKENLHEKYEKVQTLKALIKEWEESPNPDWIYIFKLQQKLKKAEKQLEHMRP